MPLIAFILAFSSNFLKNFEILSIQDLILLETLSLISINFWPTFVAVSLTLLKVLETPSLTVLKAPTTFSLALLYLVFALFNTFKAISLIFPAFLEAIAATPVPIVTPTVLMALTCFEAIVPEFTVTLVPSLAIFSLPAL